MAKKNNMEKNKSDHLDLLLLLEQKQKELSDIFLGTEFLDDAIDKLWDIIIYDYQIRKENDYALELLSDFGCNKISKTRLDKLLREESCNKISKTRLDKLLREESDPEF